MENLEISKIEEAIFIHSFRQDFEFNLIDKISKNSFLIILNILIYDERKLTCVDSINSKYQSNSKNFEDIDQRFSI